MKFILAVITGLTLLKLSSAIPIGQSNAIAIAQANANALAISYPNLITDIASGLTNLQQLSSSVNSVISILTNDNTLDPTEINQIINIVLDLFQSVGGTLSQVSGLDDTEKSVSKALDIALAALDAVLGSIDTKDAQQAKATIDGLKDILVTIISLIIDLSTDAATSNYVDLVLTIIAGASELTGEVRSAVSDGTIPTSIVEITVPTSLANTTITPTLSLVL